MLEIAPEFDHLLKRYNLGLKMVFYLISDPIISASFSEFQYPDSPMND